MELHSSFVQKQTNKQNKLTNKTPTNLKSSVIVLQDATLMKRMRIMVYKIKECGVLMSVQKSSVKGWFHGKSLFARLLKGKYILANHNSGSFPKEKMRM